MDVGIHLIRDSFHRSPCGEGAMAKPNLDASKKFLSTFPLRGTSNNVDHGF